MESISQLLEKLFKLAGGTTDAAEFKDLVSNADLTKIQVPDVVRSKILNGLFNTETAKANFDLQNHFKAQTLNAVDQKIGDLITALGLEGDHLAAVQSEKNTYSKFDLVKTAATDRINTLSEAAKGKGGKNQEQIDAFNAKIKELNDQITGLKTTHTEELGALRGEMATERLDSAFNTWASNQAYPEEALKHVSKDLLVRQAVDAAKVKLEVLGATPKLVEGKVKLFQAANPEEAFYLDGEIGDFGAIGNKALADAKLVGVNNDKNKPNPPPPGGGGGGGGAGGGGNGAPVVSHTVTQSVDEQLANLDQ